MEISETKKQIVIDNYFKTTCDVNTSIKEAFTKGFEVGLTKAVFPKDQYEARLKADLVAMFTELLMDIEECVDGAEGSPQFEQGVTNARVQVVGMIQEKIDKLKGNEDD